MRDAPLLLSPYTSSLVGKLPFSRWSSQRSHHELGHRER